VKLQIRGISDVLFLKFFPLPIFLRDVFYCIPKFKVKQLVVYSTAIVLFMFVVASEMPLRKHLEQRGLNIIHLLKKNKNEEYNLYFSKCHFN